jgi:hypothetical protein
MSLKESQKRLAYAQAALDAGVAKGKREALNPPAPPEPSGGVVGFKASTTPNNLGFVPDDGPSHSSWRKK